MKTPAYRGILYALVSVSVAMTVAAAERWVGITENGFVPERIEVSVGDPVVWRNLTQKDQTVICKEKPGAEDQESFTSGPIEPRTSWRHRFLKEGTYSYFNATDKSMMGTVVVTPE
jgi:plastocyanin